MSRTIRTMSVALAAGACLLAAGCASPGPPRPPSLQLPEPARDLSVSREGEAVAVRFMLPERTTDNLPIREGAVVASLCRGPEGSPCVTVAARQNQTLKVTPGTSVEERTVTWNDPLPAADTRGEPKLLIYRVQLSNLGGKTAGWSEPAYTASGAAPQTVEGLHAEETRSGILLRWQPGGNDEVLFERENLAPPSGKKKAAALEPVWLASHSEASGPQADETLDSSATEDVPYRYTAVRRQIVELGHQKIELRSSVSSPIEITWRNLFPPSTPTGLSAAPFTENGGYAVDLVWEPVEELGLKGYIVIRESGGSKEQLTPQPIPLPAFHDATAKPGVRYQYDVQAVGHKGTHSASAVVVVEPNLPS